MWYGAWMSVFDCNIQSWGWDNYVTNKMMLIQNAMRILCAFVWNVEQRARNIWNEEPLKKDFS